MNRLFLAFCGLLFLFLLLPPLALRADEAGAKGAADADVKVVAKDIGAKDHDPAHQAAGAAGTAGAAAHPSLGKDLSVLTVLPFVALLGFIAICPLFFAHWWEKNQNKGIIVGLLSVPLALYLIFLVDWNWSHDLLEKIKEYI